MLELDFSFDTLKTPEELAKAIEQYRMNDLSGQELFRQWQAIRIASIEQPAPNPEMKDDHVQVEHSY